MYARNGLPASKATHCDRKRPATMKARKGKWKISKRGQIDEDEELNQLLPAQLTQYEESLLRLALEMYIRDEILKWPQIVKSWLNVHDRLSRVRLEEDMVHTPSLLSESYLHKPCFPARQRNLGKEFGADSGRGVRFSNARRFTVCPDRQEAVLPDKMKSHQARILTAIVLALNS
ncbi:hypothetical protein KIN20_020534 [Parelaphostrongylus tenuis]|nr:hypothetical protein KIN20_020534 [Parelaphostrongylus tenuis]